MTAKLLNFREPPRSSEATSDQGHLSRTSAVEIGKALQAGICLPDASFDRFLPDELREISGVYWTPLIVALRAAEWFDELDIQSVVDIGSGAGKFCVAAALVGRASYVGIEHRPRFVAAARDLARTFAVEARVSFVEGTFGVDPVPIAEAYYLFNPFGENITFEEDHLDEDVELSKERHERDIASVYALLRGSIEGTYLVTYNGFGGNVPASYREIREDRGMPNLLRVWRKYR